MSFRCRLFATAALLLLASAAPGAAQSASAPRSESFRIKRPTYGYFKYRIAPQVRMERHQLPLRALARAQALRKATVERQLSLQDRAFKRSLALRDGAWRRQLEVRDRAMSRLRDRMEGLKMRGFMNRRHFRTI